MTYLAKLGIRANLYCSIASRLSSAHALMCTLTHNTHTHTVMHTPSTEVKPEKSSTNKLADSPGRVALYGVTVNVQLVTDDSMAKWNTVPVMLKLSDSAKLFIPAVVS